MTKLGLPVATVDCSHGKGETPGDGRVGLGVRLNPYLVSRIFFQKLWMYQHHLRGAKMTLRGG